MIKLLIGGSPCTFWSIAQKNNRETEAEGLGWELFKNYLVAKEKFKPDFFLYENNKSAAQTIKDQIKHELNVWDGTLCMEDSGARYIEINSALVSAQNRQRFYVHNCGEVGQPKDRGILLKDILETTTSEKGYIIAEPVCVQEQVKGRKANEDGTYTRQYEARIDGKSGTLTGTMRQNAVAEPVNMTADGKAQCLRATCYKDGIRNLVANDIDRRACVAEPIRVGALPRPNGELSTSQGMRVYSVDGKSVAQTANGGGMGGKTGLYAVPVGETLAEEYYKGGFDGDLIGMIENPSVCRNGKQPSQQYRVYSCDGKSVCVDQDQRKFYIIPYDGKTQPIYEVKDGQITIKGKQYPIKLADGFYIIRKLTVTECARLQTMPDDYCRAVSNSQAYKGLGNGWTAEVIMHILSGALASVPRDEEIVVLSMYDGIATGRYCLDKLGFSNIKYYAYEIDKYAMKIAKSNYPDIIEMGDAFKLRDPDWTIGY